jgi:tRNA pseudouridine38-40 synthase
MPRYFIELAYKGTNYAGFQKQENANTIQAELEKAMLVYFRIQFDLTGSSRTDAGVHAKQNFFHFDSHNLGEAPTLTKAVYHLNAILPKDIVVKAIMPVKDDAHCRFDALTRTYNYTIYKDKDPFQQDTGYFYPFTLDIKPLQLLAEEFIKHTDFESFAKRNTQVHTFNCSIYKSEWLIVHHCLVYSVTANRFLRGMVKGMVGTMLRSASKNLSMEEFRSIITSKNPSRANFAVPAQGLMLVEVTY